jgi:transposase-like protein
MASAEGWRRSLQGLSEGAFRERFGTEEACRTALFEMRWREGLTCPACGHRGFCALKTRQLFQCNRCKKQVRLTAGTVFQDTKLPLTAWFLALYHLSQSKGGISSIELARRLGVRQPTAWLLKHKLMRVMREREAQKPQLEGRIEIDDAYLGGERSGGKRGRGAAGKTPIVAAVETTAERKPRRLRLTVVKGFRKKEIEKLAKRDLAPGSNIVSDGLSCWPAVEKAGCDHFPMVTGSGKQAARWAPFRWVNTVLGNIKTAIAGTYHHVSAKHAQSYLTSFAYRFNRRYQLDSIVERLAWAAAHTTPQPIGSSSRMRQPDNQECNSFLVILGSIIA